MLQYYNILNLSIYLSLSVCCIFSCYQLASFPFRLQNFLQSCKIGLVVMNSISFCLSGNVFISPFWSTALTDEVFLVGSLFLSAFWIYYPTICLSLEFGKSSAIYFLNSFLFSCASLLFLWYQYSTDCFSWWTILIVHKAVLRNSRSRNTQLFFTFFHSFLYFCWLDNFKGPTS